MRVPALCLGIALLCLLPLESGASTSSDREFQECSDCPQMVGIPAGSFTMGSPAQEQGRFDNEGPQHAVSIKAFAIGKYQVRSEDFLTFLRDTGYQPAACNTILDMKWSTPERGLAFAPSTSEPPKWPAVCLDWRDAEAYIAWLNKKVHQARPSLANRTGPYRLPSEAEWEYAARAGTTTARWWGDAIGINNANCNGCGSQWDNRVLSDVDAFAPNPFGLYGTLGNSWEWTADCWNTTYVGAPRDGRPWKTGDCTRRVVRGGSWNNLPVFVRSAARNGSLHNGDEYDYSSLAGFRVARDLP
ncbi:MAG TPA: formylglycine-generating enzyme family protein [Rhizomicrobium sp.]|nr:formylglycine-generating enzyme family protein [Rhizomicrobium sp.]